MSLVFTPYGILIAGFLGIFLVLFSRSNWAGALSLPSMTIITGLIYFYVFPYLFSLGGSSTFFGLQLDGLVQAQFALALYMVGAFAAFVVGRRVWQRDPSVSPPILVSINPVAMYLLLGLIGLAVATKFYLGLLSLGEVEEDSASEAVYDVQFLNLAFSAAIPLVVYNLIRSKYSPVSLLILVAVLFVFLIDGFRFRIVILCAAAAISYCYYRGIRPGILLVGFAMLSAMFVSNVIELTRSYGRGMDLDRIDGADAADLLLGVGGEIGPVFVLSHLTQQASDMIQFDPWIIAATRLVPTFLWPDKPFPDYLRNYASGFPSANAAMAGIAGTQHAEFYMQFGWLGLPFLAFGFFMLAIWTIKRLSLLSPEARLAGMAIVPSLFGFYAQQRGYAFQFLCELIFTLFPLFWIHIQFFKRKPRALRRSAAVSR